MAFGASFWQQGVLGIFLIYLLNFFICPFLFLLSLHFSGRHQKHTRNGEAGKAHHAEAGQVPVPRVHDPHPQARARRVSFNISHHLPTRQQHGATLALRATGFSRHCLFVCVAFGQVRASHVAEPPFLRSDHPVAALRELCWP